jgi:hypothetical protein
MVLALLLKKVLSSREFSPEIMILVSMVVFSDYNTPGCVNATG